MNGTYKITGGIPLKGQVTPIPNKNSILGALPVSVLSDGGIKFVDLPKTSDVSYFLEIFESCGATIEINNKTTTVDCSEIYSFDIPPEIGRKFRGVFSLTGPLLARFDQAVLPLPGGCQLGMRSISSHVNAFRELGIHVDFSEDSVIFKRPPDYLRKAKVWLLEASVTATLNVAAYAAAVDGEIEIVDAACEPHVCDVLNALVTMGAKIEGIGSNHLFIKGTTALKECTFEASPDFVDIAGYIVAAAVTKGTITISDSNIPLIVDGIIKWFKLFGMSVVRDGNNIIADGTCDLCINTTEFPLAGKDLPKFVTRPWPGFPVDVLPVMVTLATKAKGRILFQNWMYESGFDFVRELTYMGAEIYMSDPQRIIVMDSPVKYKGGEVGSPGIIQGTKAIFLAALADNETTILHGTNILKRRYPEIDKTYKRLGANIEPLES
ncbi:MAG: UDP-N-acetylglucosamine 1-carboxyvinyltransferase [Spirochaetes bacterium]|nr:UDP-N-acetylglucosamine 1-carboxyvinyltransferase [Spirochaetota bacterium]